MRQKSILVGVLGAAAMTAVFLGITSLAESFDYALIQFTQLWHWILLLSAGFGVQIGLHVHIREKLRQRQAQATAGVAASGGVSTLAMVACCVHRVTDVLPFLGASAAAVFLVQYQTPFLVLGVFSNLLGILFLFRIMQKHRLGPESGLLKAFLDLNLKRGLAAVAAVGVLSVGTSAALSVGDVSAQPSGSRAVSKTFDLPARENDANGLVISVKPVQLTLESPIRFTVALNTHAGSLAIDFAKAATLVDNKGNLYQSTGWDGPPPGGHHVSGALLFPPLGPDVSSFRLILKDVYDVPERTYEWQLE